MSLAIDIDNVTAVLLADGWHEVLNDSFTLDAYEFIQRPAPYDARLDYERRGQQAWESDFTLILGGGREPLLPATGFSFQGALAGQAAIMSGPLTSILAVTHRA